MKKILGLVVSLTVISGVCAAVLAYVDSVTKGPIAEMKVKQEQAAVKAVMPAGVTSIQKSRNQTIEQSEQSNNEFFVGKDAAGKVIGYAAKGLDPKGYGGDIVLMVGFKADKKTVECYKTLVATETPGLGMKLSAPEFAGQFAGKDGSALKVKKDGGAIEAIASATITSRAVCRAIADAQKKLN